MVCQKKKNKITDKIDLDKSRKMNDSVDMVINLRVYWLYYQSILTHKGLGLLMQIIYNQSIKQMP